MYTQQLPAVLLDLLQAPPNLAACYVPLVTKKSTSQLCTAGTRLKTNCTTMQVRSVNERTYLELLHAFCLDLVIELLLRQAEGFAHKLLFSGR